MDSIRLGSHWRHNDHNHNHKGRCVAYVVVGNAVKHYQKDAFDRHNHNHKKMIVHFLMIMTLSMIMVMVVMSLVGTKPNWITSECG